MSLYKRLENVLLPSDSKQRLRIKRLCLGFLSYLVCCGVVLCFYFWDIFRLPLNQTILFIFSSVLINLVFYAIFRAGLNKRFRDPSLTLLQVWTGTVYCMLTIYFANAHRGILLILYFIAFVFGVFRFGKREFFITFLFGIVTYSVVVMLLWKRHPEFVDLKIEILQGIVLAISLMWFSMIASYISDLRSMIDKSYARLLKAYDKIADMANRDYLTGFPNRKHIMELLNEEKTRADRYNTTFSICFTDIDYFKRINDTFGHRVGDSVLKEFCKVLDKGLRKTDKLGRYGGEEFIIIFPHTDLHSALLCVSRLKDMVEKHRFNELPEGYTVTASFGVCEYRWGESIDDLIIRADKCLYKAKEAGRNSIVFE